MDSIPVELWRMCMNIGMDDLSLVGLFGGCFYGAYTIIRGIKTGEIVTYINRRKRTFRRGERYFTAVLAIHSLLIVAGTGMGGWLVWQRFS